MSSSYLKRTVRAVVPYMLLLVMLFLAQGCGVGLAVKGNNVAVIDNPIIGSRKGIIYGQPQEKPQTKAEDLRNYWGPPDDVETEDTSEYWRYNTGIRWNGLKLIVSLIPLPLEIPVGHDHLIFKIENRLISQVTATCDDITYGLLCGYYPDPHNFRWMCGQHNREEAETGRILPLDFIGTSDDFKWFFEKRDSKDRAIKHLGEL